MVAKFRPPETARGRVIPKDVALSSCYLLRTHSENLIQEIGVGFCRCRLCLQDARQHTRTQGQRPFFHTDHGTKKNLSTTDPLIRQPIQRMLQRIIKCYTNYIYYFVNYNRTDGNSGGVNEMS